MPRAERREVQVDVSEIFRKASDVLSGKEHRDQLIQVLDKVLNHYTESHQRLTDEQARAVTAFFDARYREYLEEDELTIFQQLFGNGEEEEPEVKAWEATKPLVDSMVGQSPEMQHQQKVSSWPDGMAPRHGDGHAVHLARLRGRGPSLHRRQ